MDTRNYRDRLRDLILQKIQKMDLTSSDWSKEIQEYRDPSSKTEVIWLLKELVEKGEYIEKAIAIADVYSNDLNPEAGYDDLNKKIEEGEDPRLIYTVRGTVPWLLQTLIATLKTEYYPHILDIVEKLAIDPIYYVRQQATVALSLFAANIRAKQNKDGTPFDFKDTDRIRVSNLAFKMLRDNRDLPRVLEYVANVFDKLRFITEEQAKEVLTIFCYDKNRNVNPEYLTSHVVPLILFFAEFRTKFDPTFKNEWFQNFLKKFINDTKDYNLKSTLIWHTWRVIEDDTSNYSIVKPYIPLFFNDIADHEPIGQMEFLVNAVLKASTQEGTELYEKFLEYLNNKLQISSTFKIWFTHTEEIIRMIDPLKLDKILSLLKELRRKGCYIGDENIIFSSEKKS